SRDERPQRTQPEQVAQVLQVRSIHCGLARHEGVPPDTTYLVALEQGQIRRQQWDPSAGKSDNQQATLVGHAPRRRIECVTTDGVETDIDAVVRREVRHLRLKVRSAVVDKFVGTVLAGYLQLLRRARGRKDPGTQSLADLNRR